MTLEWTDISAPPSPAVAVSSAQIIYGPRIPAQQQLLLYSADQWEQFVQEWVHCCLKKQYIDVKRFSGAGDQGVDVAGFCDNKKLQGIWDNYQCKHYAHALLPGDVWVEFGKIIWYSFNQEYTPPRKYYFVAPMGAGTGLTKLLADAEKLRAAVIEKWKTHIESKITDTRAIPLEGALLTYVQNFDFSIFDSKNSLQLVEEHKETPYFAVRFGGGLPARPIAAPAPSEIDPVESRYVSQLLGAYADHKKTDVPDPTALKSWPPLQGHFARQREAFYQAESLRVFARDSVPAGTFEALQGDIYDGVVDTHDAEHPDGYARVVEVTKAARELQITANALISCTNPKDRDGICHQLANEDRLRWCK